MFLNECLNVINIPELIIHLQYDMIYFHCNLDNCRVYDRTLFDFQPLLPATKKSFHYYNDKYFIMIL